MLGKDIASMEAFNKLATGDYDNLQTELQSFVGGLTSAKSLKKKLLADRQEYFTRINGQAEAKISVLAKGATDAVQFSPNAGFLAALDAAVAAVTAFETAYGAIDFPTA